MTSSIELLSLAPQQKRDDVGNIIYPIVRQSVNFKFGMPWNTGIPINADDCSEPRLGILPNGDFVRMVPTATIDVGFEITQVRLHDDEENWGFSQYLFIMKQSDVEKKSKGITNALLSFWRAQPDDYRLVALPTCKFQVVSLSGAETKSYGFAELNADGFFREYKCERPVPDVHLEKAHIYFDEPFVIVFSQQRGFWAQLRHILVGFVSKLDGRI